MPLTSVKNQIVFVTGASSGIGRATAAAFAAEGSHLILSARRGDRISELSDELRQRHGIDVLAFALDVRDADAVAAAVKDLPERWQPIDILVNNAGLSRGLDKIHEANIQDWEEMIDTNVKGLLYVTRAILPGMVSRGRGHVVNIGSVAGRDAYPGGNVYSATKSAVAMLARGMRMDLLGAGVRVTNIEPGMVETEFSKVRFHGDEARASKVYQGIDPLTPEDIADAIVWSVTRPSHVTIGDMLILASAQASATMAHRRSAEA
jgi:3-hydroxy acid dehydrogenase / malonic semialdehyde reductase